MGDSAKLSVVLLDSTTRRTVLEVGAPAWSVHVKLPELARGAMGSPKPLANVLAELALPTIQARLTLPPTCPPRHTMGMASLTL